MKQHGHEHAQPTLLFPPVTESVVDLKTCAISESWSSRLDQFAVAALIVLVVSLPVASISSVRDIALGSVSFCWLAKAALTKKWRPASVPLLGPWVLYGFFVVLSLFTAVDFYYSLNEFRAEYVKNLLLFFLVTQFVTSKKRTQAILAAVVAGNLLMVSAGIIQFLTHDYRTWIVRALSPQIGWASLHSGKGTYSTYLITVFPFLFWSAFVWKNRWILTGNIMLAAANLIALYLTFQRGAWLAFVAMFFFALLVASIRPWARWTCFLLLFSGLATAVWLAPTIVLMHGKPIPSFAEFVRERDEHFPRAGIWQASLKYLFANPIRGAGIGRASPRKKYPFFQENGGHWHAHNVLMNAGLQLGIPGLLALLILWGKLAQLAWRNYRRPPPADRFVRYTTFALILMMVAFFVRNMFDDFFVDDTALLFWFLSGTVLGGMTRVEPGGLGGGGMLEGRER